MTDKLEALFAGAVTPGVYRAVVRAGAVVIARRAQRHGWRLFHLNGLLISSKAEFLTVSAAAMDFPAYFGHNWDAFEESARDLAWAPAGGYLVLWDDAGRFAEAQPQEFAVALDIMRFAVTHWRGTPTPMIVLLRGTRGRAMDVPRL